MPNSARQTASRARWPSAPDEALVPQTKDDVELVEHRADGDRRGDRHGGLEVLARRPTRRTVSSTTTVTWLRRVSRYCRTSSADSPSRPPSPWPTTASGCGAGRHRGRTRAARGRPGRSGRPRRSRRPRGRAAGRRPASPAAPSAGAPGPRAPAVHTTSREKMPTGSPRRVVAGPTGMTPRRSVRMVKHSSCVSPRPAATRCRSGAPSDPTGTSSVVGQQPCGGDVAHHDPGRHRVPPAITRSGCSRRSTRRSCARAGTATASRQAAAGRRPPAPPSRASRPEPRR